MLAAVVVAKVSRQWALAALSKAHTALFSMRAYCER
jgi:hypothetical protein